MKLYLNRFCFNPDKDAGTFGKLETGNKVLGYTVEKSWKDNEPYNSCVPDGSYKLIPYTSEKYGECFILVNPVLGVYAHKEDRMLDTDRFMCLFAHRGNYPSNFQGCIGLGDSLAINEGQMMVTNTTKTCKRVMEEIPRTIHEIVIYSSGGAI